MFISIFQQQHQITIQRRTDDEVVIVYVWVCSDFTENYVHLYTTRECSMRFSTFYYAPKGCLGASRFRSDADLGTFSTFIQLALNRNLELF